MSTHVNLSEFIIVDIHQNLTPNRNIYLKMNPKRKFKSKHKIKSTVREIDTLLIFSVLVFFLRLEESHAASMSSSREHFISFFNMGTLCCIDARGPPFFIDL